MIFKQNKLFDHIDSLTYNNIGWSLRLKAEPPLTLKLFSFWQKRLKNWLWCMLCKGKLILLIQLWVAAREGGTLERRVNLGATASQWSADFFFLLAQEIRRLTASLSTVSLFADDAVACRCRGGGGEGVMMKSGLRDELWKSRGRAETDELYFFEAGRRSGLDGNFSTGKPVAETLIAVLLTMRW